MLMEGDYVQTRRREKHSMPVDPNNKHWVNDKSKFGYKMLMKMGWSEGKGLGSNEQGMTENIVQVKNDERVGLGATVDTSSNWLENTSAYSQLLSSLKNKFNTPSTKQEDSGDKEEAVNPKCVIFNKRARAKSIRTKSKQDLAAILGRRPDEPSDDEEIPGSTDSDSESRKKTKKRKAEIEEVEELNVPVEDEQEKKKKKKEKKSKRKQEIQEEEEQTVELPTPAEEEEVVSKKDKKKKKEKKSKKNREEVVEAPVEEETPVVETSEKKKKKKRKNRETTEEQ